MNIQSKIHPMGFDQAMVRMRVANRLTFRIQDIIRDEIQQPIDNQMWFSIGGQIRNRIQTELKEIL
jgi:hypothetical protein